MDHIRISGTESSSAILSQTIQFDKLINDASKVSQQSEVKWDGVITPQKYNFNDCLNTEKIGCSQNATN